MERKLFSWLISLIFQNHKSNLIENDVYPIKNDTW